LKVVPRLESAHPSRWQRILPWAGPALAAVGALSLLASAIGIVALIFQLFFRYQYLENNGVLWRIDRVTQQMCQVHVGEAKCTTDTGDATAAPAVHKFSNSTSTSISTSVSTSLQSSSKHRH
jgi:hypothetical protein